MTQLTITLFIIILLASSILGRAKSSDWEEEITKRLERLERKEDSLDSNLKDIKSSLDKVLEGIDTIQETGESDMAAITDTNVVFRCNKQFKGQIESWAKEHELNLSEACRNLINLELSKKQTLVDSLTFSLNYVYFLKSQGLIAASATDEELSNAAQDYTAYLSNLDKQ